VIYATHLGLSKLLSLLFTENLGILSLGRFNKLAMDFVPDLLQRQEGILLEKCQGRMIALQPFDFDSQITLLLFNELNILILELS